MSSPQVVHLSPFKPGITLYQDTFLKHAGKMFSFLPFSSSFGNSPKKGDLRDCKHYRGIMLLSFPGKGLNRIPLGGKKTAVDSKLHDHQAGLRQDRSYTDHITTLCIILEQSLDWNSSLNVNFIDYRICLTTLVSSRRSSH